MEQINWGQVAVSVILALVGSTGFWSWLQNRHDKKDAKTLLLLGLAHDRIIELGTKYLERGYITSDEFENLNDYLYVPYAKGGGNGSAKRIMEQVSKLPPHN